MAINQSNQQDDEKAQGMNSVLTNAQPQQDQGQQNNQGQQQLSTSSAVSPSQGSAPMQTGNQSPSTPAQSKAPASSGTFTNLKTYLNANQGNRIGSAANQRLQNTATGAQKAIGQASTAFGQKLEQGSLKNRENAVQDVTNIAGAARQVNAAPKPAQTTAPAAQATGTQEAQTTAPAPEQAPQYLSEDQRNRFAEVINARYQGPQSLRDAGLYDPAFQRVQTAQDRLNQVQTAGGRESMLRDTFGNRAYSQGQNKLDSILLNADQGAVQNLLSKRDQIGNLQNKLSTAQNEAQNLSNQRTQEIANIQEQARQGFTSAQTAEKEATDARLSQVVENWNQLPEYYKEIIRKSPAGQVAFSEEEASRLGLTSGTGLYNLGEDAIRTAQAEKDRLVSRDEVARQQALAQLAGLDQQRRLNTDVKYSDMSRAGTQTAMDALDVAATQQALKEAEENFRQYAENANLTGTGMKKHRSSGKKYYASESANLGNLLKQAGYNFDAPEFLSANRAATDVNTSSLMDQDGLDGTGEYSSGEVLDPLQIGSMTGTGLSAPAGVVVDALGNFFDATGKAIANPNIDTSEVVNPYTNNQSTAQKATTAVIDGGTGGMTALLRAAGVDVAGIVGNALGFGGPSSRYAKDIAQQQAYADLQNKIRGALTSSGFENRVNIQDNDATRARTEGLRQILANMDKTNLG